MIQLGYFIDPWIFSTCDFHTLIYTTIVTSWKYRNNTPCTRSVILVQFSHNHMCKKMSEYPSHSFTYSIYFHLPPPPRWYILSTNFWNMIQLITIFKILHKHYLQCKEIPKAVTEITFWHKVNFSLQNRCVFNDNIITIVWKFKKYVIQTSISHFWTSTRVRTPNLSTWSFIIILLRMLPQKQREGYNFFSNSSIQRMQ